MLSEEAIKEFQMIYKTQYGQDISMEEAAEKGEMLLRLFKAVYKPGRKDKVCMTPRKDSPVSNFLTKSR